jgi:hypothetical protein
MTVFNAVIPAEAGIQGTAEKKLDTVGTMMDIFK